MNDAPPPAKEYKLVALRDCPLPESLRVSALMALVCFWFRAAMLAPVDKRKLINCFVAALLEPAYTWRRRCGCQMTRGVWPWLASSDGYDAIDYGLLWQSLETRVPGLLATVEQMLQDLDSSGKK